MFYTHWGSLSDWIALFPPFCRHDFSSLDTAEPRGYSQVLQIYLTYNEPYVVSGQIWARKNLIQNNSSMLCTACQLYNIVDIQKREPCLCRWLCWFVARSVTVIATLLHCSSLNSIQLGLALSVWQQRSHAPTPLLTTTQIQFQNFREV